MIEPITGESNSPGIAVSVITRPELADEPVISSASHGIKMNTIEPEIMLVSEASSVRTNGASLRFWLTEFEVVKRHRTQIAIARIANNFVSAGVSVNYCCHGNDDCSGVN
jgi:hypothetical protein